MPSASLLDGESVGTVDTHQEVYGHAHELVLDDELVEEAFRRSDAKTERGLVDRALREFAENRLRKDIRESRGKISFHPGYDCKALREGK